VADHAPPPIELAWVWLTYVEPRPQQQRATVAFALWDGWGDAAELLFFEWLRRHPEHDAKREQGGRDTWRSARKPGSCTWRTLRSRAWAGGWRPEPTAPHPPPPTAEALARQQAERDARAEAAAAERQASADAAALDARQRLAATDPADPEHPYLRRKSVTPTADMRQEGNALLVPVADLDGQIRGVQIIDATGVKRFSRGTSAAGALWWARPPAGDQTGAVYVVEGVATGLTVAAAIPDAAVAVAFSAHNLPAVVAALRQHWPAAEIIIAADNDANGTGHKYAVEAAADFERVRIRLPVFAPEAQLDGKAPTDFNDLHQIAGLDEVHRQLLAEPTELDADPPTAPAPEHPGIYAPEVEVDDDPADSPKGGRRPSALDVVLALVGDLELFHDADGGGQFAAEIAGRREVWAIQSRAGADLLTERYLARTGRGLPSQALKDALATLDARARFRGQRREVYLRTARFPDRLLIDLTDDGWRVIEVTADGWRVLDRSPVPFVRRAGMAPLPEPQRGGSVAELRDFLNVRDTDFRLVVGWLLGALGGRGPFPALVLQAEQGAGKSTAARVLRALVDPANVPLKAPPRTADDWAIAAAVSYVLALDNLSGLTDEQSDILCRLLTGAGISKRKLYTDLDEIQLHLCRPALLNGIAAIATRPDLADRSLTVTLLTIPEARRRKEADFWYAFDAARPRLLGALLDALSGALKHSGKAPPPDLPRMADFAAWVCAAEPALGWPAGSFLDAYRANIEGAAEAAVEASPVGVAVLALLNREPSVTYNATSLMPALENAAPAWAPRSPAWPRSPRGLTDSLRRLKAPLRQLGIEFFEHRDARGRWITIRRRPQRAPDNTIDEVIF
jgi:hypothetical protein